MLLRSNSPTHDPSSNNLPLQNCLLLKIGREIGMGATGRTHDASLSLPGHIPLQNLVAKLAFTHYQQTRLAHEGKIYQRLTQHDIKAVPKYYGFFQDTAGTVAALVTEHVGLPLTTKSEWAHLTHPYGPYHKGFVLPPLIRLSHLYPAFFFLHSFNASETKL